MPRTCLLAGALALAAMPAATLVAAPAFAAAIDLSPAIDYGLEVVFSVGVAVAIAVLTYGAALLRSFVKAKLGVDLAILETRDNATLHAGIQRGANWLEGVARERFFGPNGQRVNFDVDNPVVAEIAQRMIDKSPGLLKRVGLDGHGLKELVAEKLNSAPPGGQIGWVDIEAEPTPAT